MNAAYTPSRIAFKEGGEANQWAMLTEDGRWLLALLHNGEALSATQAANFRRLEACWNSWHGMPTEAIQQLQPLGGVQALTNRGADLKDQKAELLVCLKQCLPIIDAYRRNPGVDGELAAAPAMTARRLIFRLTGEKL